MAGCVCASVAHGLVCLCLTLVHVPAVDATTDALVQTTVRTQFAGATVITIAHRLSTIMVRRGGVTLAVPTMSWLTCHSMLLRTTTKLWSWLKAVLWRLVHPATSFVLRIGPVPANLMVPAPKASTLRSMEATASSPPWSQRRAQLPPNGYGGL